MSQSLQRSHQCHSGENNARLKALSYLTTAAGLYRAVSGDSSVNLILFVLLTALLTTFLVQTLTDVTHQAIKSFRR